MSSPNSPRDDTVDVATVVGVLWRRWFLVVGCVVLGVLAAVLAAAALPATYTATSTVVVAPLPSNPLAANAASTRDISMVTETRVISSSVVAQQVATDLRTGRSARSLLHGLHVTSPANSVILQISYAAHDARSAAATANAFSDAYLAYRSDQASEGNRRTAQAVEARTAQLQAQADQMVAGGQTLSPQAAEAHTGLLQDIVDLRRQASQLAATPVAAGQVIDRPSPAGAAPAGRSRLFLASGALLGCLSGVLLALAAHSRADRLLGANDLQGALSAPTLVSLPRPPRGRPPGTCSALLRDPDGEAAEGFRVLAAKLESPSIARGATRVLVVEEPSSSAAPAADLALAFAARTGATVLVAPLQRLQAMAQGRSIAAAPTGGDLRVLAGVDGLWLLALDADEDGSPGLFSSAAVGGVTQSFKHVVVDGTGLRLSRLLTVVASVDGALVVATHGRSRRSDVREVVSELSQMDTPVLGGALVSAPRRRRTVGAAPGGVRASRRPAVDLPRDAAGSTAG